MPIIDRREIEFDEKGLLDALMAMHGRQAVQLPEVRASSAEFDSRSHQITLNYNTVRGTRSIPLRPEVLGVILVTYCIRARFPIPRKASKGIRITPKSAILSFHTKFDDLPDPFLQPSRDVRHSAKRPMDRHELGEVVLFE